jgi:hypothetical protein
MKMPSADELFKKFDTNGDGVLSKEEFAAGLKKFHERTRERMGAPSGEPGGPPFGPRGMRPFGPRPFGPMGVHPFPGPLGMSPPAGPKGMARPEGPKGSEGMGPPAGRMGMGAFGGGMGMGAPGGPMGTGSFGGPMGMSPHFGPPGTRPPFGVGPFDRFDKNKDGKLTEDEVPAPLWERLSKADAVKDGAITKNAFEAAFKKMMEERGAKRPQ